MHDDFDEVTCPVCESDQKPNLSYTGDHGGEWYRCRHCGMTFTTPLDVPDDD